MKTMNRMAVAALAMICLLLSTVSHANAQQKAISGLVIMVDGDLWEYNPNNNNTRQLTQWGYNGVPVISPDAAASYVAYTSASERFVNSEDIFYAGDVPSNIWLMDLQEGTFTRIADQPANLDTFRSTPSWSPDGTRLAWTELDVVPGQFDFKPARLVTYNINTGQKDIITTEFDLGPQDGGLYMPRVNWGAGGIMRIITPYMGGADTPQLLELYDPDTHQVRSFEIARVSFQNNNSDFAWESMWAMENGKPYIVLYMRNSGWQKLDPVTGVRSPLAVPPSLGVKWGIAAATMLTPTFQPVGDSHMWRWQAELLYDGGVPGKTVDLGFETQTLASWVLPTLSGSYQVAWSSRYQQGVNRTVNVWQDSNTQQLQQVIRSDSEYGEMGVAWLPTQWYITDSTPPPPVPTVTPLPPGQCPPTHPTVLEVGELVQVSPGPPNNLRAEPSTNGRVLGVLPAGTFLTIMSNAICADGFNWYQVQYTHGTGWTAEGNGTEFWLQPAG